MGLNMPMSRKRLALSGSALILTMAVVGSFIAYPSWRDWQDELRLGSLLNVANPLADMAIHSSLPSLRGKPWRSSLPASVDAHEQVCAIATPEHRWLCEDEPSAFALIFLPSNVSVDPSVNLVVSGDAIWLESANGHLRRDVDVRGSVVLPILRGTSHARIPDVTAGEICEGLRSGYFRKR